MPVSAPRPKDPGPWLVHRHLRLAVAYASGALAQRVAAGCSSWRTSFTSFGPVGVLPTMTTSPPSPPASITYLESTLLDLSFKIKLSAHSRRACCSETRFSSREHRKCSWTDFSFESYPSSPTTAQNGGRGGGASTAAPPTSVIQRSSSSAVGAAASKQPSSPDVELAEALKKKEQVRKVSSVCVEVVEDDDESDAAMLITMLSSLACAYSSHKV